VRLRNRFTQLCNHVADSRRFTHHPTPKGVSHISPAVATLRRFASLPWVNPPAEFPNPESRCIISADCRPVCHVPCAICHCWLRAQSGHRLHHGLATNRTVCQPRPTRPNSPTAEPLHATLQPCSRSPTLHASPNPKPGFTYH